LDSREVSGKPKDEEAQYGEETSIPPTVSKTHGGAAKSPRGAMGGGGDSLRGVRGFLGFLSAGRGLIYSLRGGWATRHEWLGDPAASRGAPGDPTQVAERPDTSQSRAGSTEQLCQLTRPSPEYPKEVDFDRIIFNKRNI
jgi:hypothetical protein